MIVHIKAHKHNNLCDRICTGGLKPEGLIMSLPKAVKMKTKPNIYFKTFSLESLFCGKDLKQITNTSFQGTKLVSGW